MEDVAATGDVVIEAREFRRALVEWTRNYLATNGPAYRSERFNADFKAAMRRWSAGYASRLDGSRPAAGAPAPPAVVTCPGPRRWPPVTPGS